MTWITDREIGWLAWKAHNLRYFLITKLVGKDRVVMNVELNRDGMIGGPAPGGRMLVHNVTADIEGRTINLEATMWHHAA